jgi:hypothetical protein
MSPLQIEILLHYYKAADDFRDGDFSAPAVRKAINIFREEGYLRSEKSVSGRCYDLSPKGYVYVTALMDVPEPVQHWVVHYPRQSPTSAD